MTTMNARVPTDNMTIRRFGEERAAIHDCQKMRRCWSLQCASLITRTGVNVVVLTHTGGRRQSPPNGFPILDSRHIKTFRTQFHISRRFSSLDLVEYREQSYELSALQEQLKNKVCNQNSEQVPIQWIP